MTTEKVEPWTCKAHGVTTTGDCPRCDDELIALTDDDEPRFNPHYGCVHSIGYCHAESDR